MLDFAKGDALSPTGNLIVFCNVRGENPVDPGGSIIVSNVFVSFLSARKDTFPVVVFPPMSLESEDELDDLLCLNERADVLQVDDFEKPPDKSMEEYIEDRMQEFNMVVVDYVELCRSYIEKREKELKIAPVELTEEAVLARLDTIKDLRHAQLDNYLTFLEANFSKYDAGNLRRALDSQPAGSYLARLYIKKFQAIYQENYEHAARLQKRIDLLQNLQPRSVT